MKTEKQPMTIWLATETHRRLGSAAKELGVSMADAIRLSLHELFRKMDVGHPVTSERKEATETDHVS